MKKLIALLLLFSLVLPFASCGDQGADTWAIEPGPTTEAVQISDREATETISSFDDMTAGECYLASGDLTVGEEYIGRTLDFLGSTIRGKGNVTILASDVTILSLALDEMSLVIDPAATGVTVENVYITGDLTAGVSSAVSNCSVSGNVSLGTGSILENSYVAGAVTAPETKNVLLAKSIVDGGVALENAYNAVLLLNRFASPLSLKNCDYLSVVENDFSDQATPLAFEGGRVTLVTGNSGFDGAVYSGETEKIYGSDIPGTGDPDEAGCDFSLLPQVENDRFVGMESTDNVRFGAETTPILSYIMENAVDGATLILPPGVYTVSTDDPDAYFAFSGLRNFRLLAYGAEIIYSSGNLVGFYFEGCDNVKLCGLTTDYSMTPYAQGVITQASLEYFIWKPDEGFTADIANPEHFDSNGAAEGFRKGQDIPYGDLTIYGREALDDGTYKVYCADPALFKEGDKVIFRMNGSHVNVFVNSRDMVYEDVTIYSGAYFGVTEESSEGGTILNRLKITPGPSPVEGGEARLISTCDATHMTSGREGPAITNCWFEKMTDDGTNINGFYAKMQTYDLKSKTLTITDFTGGSAYPYPIRKGDLLTAVTETGTLLAEGKAAADSDGTTVKVDFGVNLAGNNIIIENLSANSWGFVFENNYIAKIRSRGILIKASGKVSHNTVEYCGMAGLLVSPEIADNWGESGFVRGLDISSNLFRATGLFFYKNPLPQYSPISVYGGTSSGGDAATLPMRDLTISNNRVVDRYSDYALSVEGVDGLTITGNDFGVRVGKDIIRGREINDLASKNDDKLVAAFIGDAAHITFENNIVPKSAKEPYTAHGILE